MVFKDERCTVFKKLSNSKYISYIDWPKFVQDKDIGIVCIDAYTHYYKIVNEKKWLISRLKYGL